ncbi:hypothetical protein [Pseudohoeflea coraliihabitans]|uniref:Uncharacterized protein n=1 Tax=Pseudohoeflea coraliihabitans TaxID=2860393 RepID=A0ABS6WP84_9HYPH|nr:hypothetical protein [Pseudohoeflea sp. DP4N28-3]MBW3097212.1 hypothetical protein [Pseudohoeflea sp. DP4N28-3]
MPWNGLIVYPASQAALEALISHFALCDPRDSVVSVKRAVAAIREAVPQSKFSDEYLVNVVLEQAVLHGLNVDLDTGKSNFLGTRSLDSH